MGRRSEELEHLVPELGLAAPDAGMAGQHGKARSVVESEARAVVVRGRAHTAKLHEAASRPDQRARGVVGLAVGKSRPTRGVELRQAAGQEVVDHQPDEVHGVRWTTW